MLASRRPARMALLLYWPAVCSMLIVGAELGHFWPSRSSPLLIGCSSVSVAVRSDSSFCSNRPNCMAHKERELSAVAVVVVAAKAETAD